jgi:hypothetical protein
MDGFEYIGAEKPGFVIDPMKNDDIVDEEVGVEATGRLLLGENAPAKGFVIICAEAERVHVKKRIAPTAITPLRTIHLPRFENRPRLSHQEAGRITRDRIPSSAFNHGFHGSNG